MARSNTFMPWTGCGYQHADAVVSSGENQQEQYQNTWLGDFLVSPVTTSSQDRDVIDAAASNQTCDQGDSYNSAECNEDGTSGVDLENIDCNVRRNSEDAHSLDDESRNDRHEQRLGPLYLHAAPDAMNLNDGPWSDFNVQENLNRHPTLDPVRHAPLQDEVATSGRSRDIGSDFHCSHEEAMMRYMYLGGEPNYDRRDGVGQQSQEFAHSQHVYMQAEAEQPHFAHTPTVMLGGRALLVEQCERTIARSERNPVPNGPDSTSATLACSVFDQGSTNTLCCDESSCVAVFNGTHSKGNLGRHRRLKHSEGGPKKYACGVHSCVRAFDRKDARLKHQRKHHPNLGTPPAVRRGPRSSDDASTDRSLLA